MFQRHNRVWLTPAGWKLAGSTASATHAEEFNRWADNDWPAVVRRSETEMPVDIVCLGLAGPPDKQTGLKVRIPFSVSTNHIARQDAPLAIISAEHSLPPTWQKHFSELAQAVTSAGLEFRVYGSAAMQAITCLSYLTKESDIDLLFYPQNKEQLSMGIALLAQYAKQLPLDGEIVFPSGRAVAWREWMQAVDNPGEARVLAKSMSSLALLRTVDLCDELELSPCGM